MRLAPAGRTVWGGGGLVGIAVIVVAWLCVPDWLAWCLTAIAVTSWCSVAWFFRDPHRTVPHAVNASDLLSPADGRISAIEHVEAHECVDGPAVIIRIFLSVLNVHINRMPCDLTIIKTIYRPGKFLDARTAESAKVNESMLTAASRRDGLQLGIRQVSGAIARRIVCPVHADQSFSQGERFGMIKFGSTTELIVPQSQAMHIHVTEGDRVRGGLTVLAMVPLINDGDGRPQSPSSA